MKKNIFVVELEFDTDLPIDKLQQVADNIARAIVNETDGEGIAPEDGWFTTGIKVENSHGHKSEYHYQFGQGLVKQ